MPRSRPTSRIRCSASRSAATAGGTARVTRELEHRAGGVEDPARALLGPLEGEPLELVGDLDQAAGVDAVVGRVEDAVLLEHLLDARVGELVVGGAADDPGRQRLDDLVGQRAAERARGVDVELGGDQRGGVGDHPDLRAAPRATRSTRGLVDVGDDHGRRRPRRGAGPGGGRPCRRRRRRRCGRRASARPRSTSAAARMPWNTPYAVSTELSPAPPWATVRPVTKSHSRAMWSMSSE